MPDAFGYDKQSVKERSTLVLELDVQGELRR